MAESNGCVKATAVAFGLVGFVVIGVVGLIFVVTWSNNKASAQALEKNRKKEAARQEQADEKTRLFFQNRIDIFTEFETLVASNNMGEAVKIAEKWSAVADPQMVARFNDVREEYYLSLVKPLPADDIEGNMKWYRKLCEIRPGHAQYVLKFAHYQDKLKEREKWDSAQVELDFNWSKSHDYALVNGSVRNLTQRRLDFVKVIVEFHTSSGEFISSDFTYTDIRPLLPGQTSPFKSYTTWNPRMSICSLRILEGREQLMTRQPK